MVFSTQPVQIDDGKQGQMFRFQIFLHRLFLIPANFAVFLRLALPHPASTHRGCVQNRKRPAARCPSDRLTQGAKRREESAASASRCGLLHRQNPFFIEKRSYLQLIRMHFLKVFGSITLLCSGRGVFLSYRIPRKLSTKTCLCRHFCNDSGSNAARFDQIFLHEVLLLSCFARLERSVGLVPLRLVFGNRLPVIKHYGIIWVTGRGQPNRI